MVISIRALCAPAPCGNWSITQRETKEPDISNTCLHGHAEHTGTHTQKVTWVAKCHCFLYGSTDLQGFPHQTNPRKHEGRLEMHRTLCIMNWTWVFRGSGEVVQFGYKFFPHRCKYQRLGLQLVDPITGKWLALDSSDLIKGWIPRQIHNRMALLRNEERAGYEWKWRDILCPRPLPVFRFPSHNEMGSLPPPPSLYHAALPHQRPMAIKSHSYQLKAGNQ